MLSEFQRSGASLAELPVELPEEHLVQLVVQQVEHSVLVALATLAVLAVLVAEPLALKVLGSFLFLTGQSPVVALATVAGYLLESWLIPVLAD